jgi:hypothetical protein
MHRDDAAYRMEILARKAREAGNPLPAPEMVAGFNDLVAENFSECQTCDAEWPTRLIQPVILKNNEGGDTENHVHECPVCRAKREKHVWRTR